MPDFFAVHHVRQHFIIVPVDISTGAARDFRHPLHIQRYQKHMHHQSFGIVNSHGTFGCNDFHLQPFSKCPSLLDLARIFFPVKDMFSYTKVVRNKLRPSSKVSADVFSLLYFKMCLRSECLGFLNRKSCLFGAGFSLTLTSTL